MYDCFGECRKRGSVGQKKKNRRSHLDRSELPQGNKKKCWVDSALRAEEHSFKLSTGGPSQETRFVMAMSEGGKEIGQHQVLPNRREKEQ